MNWTKEQEDAIYKKGSNILVAAAAGSGKTAVLVERIIQKILKDGVDIDKLLVVTFTNAAASEMRERVLEAIYKKLDEEPENENLQRQIVLLGKSSICTIHSFCLDVIKNNFFEIDLSANFRIGTEEEISLLKQEVLEDYFEELYDDEDERFAKLVNTYTSYRGDESLKENVLKIYRFMQSSAFPNEWLIDKVNMFKKSEDNSDFANSIWGRLLLKDLQDELIDARNGLTIVKEKVDRYPELSRYGIVLQNDIDKYQKLYELTHTSWDEAFEFANTMKFDTWPIDRKISMDLKEEAKDSRDTIKKKAMKIIKEVLIYDSENAYNDIYEMYEVLDILKDVILGFDKAFKAKKRERNIIDFNDIEHYALKILVKKDENGNYVPTDVAKKYQEKFTEIAIDEYQDSNQVQEYILNVVSKGNNLFMVGDVKQSIYKFRQACPELFLKKYNTYSLDGNNEGLKIQLFKNFRSRKNVLDITNIMFASIMSPELGDIDYNETEYLNLGADFEDNEESNKLGIAELDIIDVKDEEKDVWKDDDNGEALGKLNSLETNDSNLDKDKLQEEPDEVKVVLEKEQVEAKFVANKIKEIIASKKKIKDKKLGYREVTYKDIVILLRSTSNVAPIYEKELLSKNIPVFSDSSNEYLNTVEIQTIVNVLKVLDNPIDDISLVAVMRSEIGSFTDNDILEIRLISKDGSYYDSLIKASTELEEGELKEKVNSFINNIRQWKLESDYLSLAELIWKIYIDTGFYNYAGLMPNGALRQANLKMLFERAKEYEKTSFKGLFNFIRFVERLKSENSDMSAAKIIGENEDVVRIMSIHKSKGLEFPIVFLSGTSKNINMTDLKSDLLLHQEIGIGPQYINYDKMIEYSTSAKDAIKIVIKDENISEEMRVLYVALTRAKEKLIITGTIKEYQKDLEKKKELLNVYNSKDGKINPILLKKYISYLDWFLLVSLSNNLEGILTINEISKKEVLDNDQEEVEEKLREFDFDKDVDIEKYDNILSWKYSDELLTTLPIKSTVSKIKEMKNKDLNGGFDFDEITDHDKQIGLLDVEPEFLNLEEKITAGRKGTLMHLFLEKIDFNKEYDIDSLEAFKEELQAKNIITEEEKKYMNSKKVLEFLKSKLVNKIKNAKKIEKEKPFCIKIKANEIYSEANEKDNMLVQGIIDLYAIDNNDNIILVDYKTDFVEDFDERKLIDRYYTQLKIYKEALEEGLDKKVSEVYIYSLYLNKEIKLEFNN